MSVNVYFEQKGDHRQISLLIFLEFRFIFSVATRPLIFDILREVITKILKLVIFCQMKMLDSIHTRRFIFFFPLGDEQWVQHPDVFIYVEPTKLSTKHLSEPRCADLTSFHGSLLSIFILYRLKSPNEFTWHCWIILCYQRKSTITLPRRFPQNFRWLFHIGWWCAWKWRDRTTCFCGIF